MIYICMSLTFNLRSGGCQSTPCLDPFGCPDGVCPDFIIRRHDTRPPLKVAMEDCDGPMDFRGLIIEVNMWALAKLKAALDESTEYFRLADDIGFEQVMVGDIIVMDRVRLPEHMLVVAFDETNKLIKVQRGYHGTTSSPWKKGAIMRIFRILNAPALAEIVFEDVQDVDGTIEKDVIQESFLVYEWQPEDTCLPGCYYLEFKVLKMIDMVWYLPGGNWTGEINIGDDGFFYTGSEFTDSSVRLSFDQVNDIYLLPDVAWSGEAHLHSDNNYYTGTIHNDGSVFLNKTGVPSDPTTSYNDSGVASLLDVSIIPSFTDESLSPYYFGCILGEGIERVQRFPLNGEGFLIRISGSPTSEF